MDFEGVLEELIRRAKGEGYSTIIIDPAYKGMIGRSENAASGVGVFCHNLEQVSAESGASVMYAHHFTKGGQSNKSPMDRMSGSGVFARDADTIITLTEHEQVGCYSVEMTLRNLPPQAPFVVQWDFPLMVVREDLDPQDLRGADEVKGGERLRELPPISSIPLLS